MKSRIKRSPIPRAVNVKFVAKVAGCSTRSIWRWVAKGKAPAPFKIGRTSRWLLSDVEAWIESCAGNRRTNGQAEHRHSRQLTRRTNRIGQATNGLS